MVSIFRWFAVGLAATLALGMVIAFLMDWRDRRSGIPRLTPKELADQLERLANSRGWEEGSLVDELDWVPIRDERLDEVRAKVSEMLEEAQGGDSWFSPQQRDDLRQLAENLRRDAGGGAGG